MRKFLFSNFGYWVSVCFVILIVCIYYKNNINNVIPIKENINKIYVNTTDTIFKDSINYKYIVKIDSLRIKELKNEISIYKQDSIEKSLFLQKLLFFNIKIINKNREDSIKLVEYYMDIVDSYDDEIHSLCDTIDIKDSIINRLRK